MRRLFCFLMVSILLFLLTIAPASAETLTIAGFLTQTIGHEINERTPRATPQWYLDWQELNPKVKIKADETIPYTSTSAVLKALGGKNMKYDVLKLYSGSFAWQSIMASGKLLDLSTDQELVSLVQQMHPLFTNAVYYNDCLYGVPCAAAFSFLCYDSEAWALAGYSENDIPTSFSSFVDFLDNWADRCLSAPVPDVCVTNAFDKLTETSYTQWLTELLVQYYTDQCLAQNKDIVFSSPEVVELLERILDVGNKLYTSDHPTNNKSLFTSSGDIKELPNIIFTRLTEDHPICIPVTLDILCIPQASKNSEYAYQFLRLYMDCIHTRTYDYATTTAADNEAMLANGLLFAGVSEAIPAYEYGKLEEARQRISKEKMILADSNSSEKERERARTIIEIFESDDYLSYLEKLEWQLTSDELAAYQALTEYMCVKDGKSKVVGSKDTRNLIKQFASGKISAQEFAKRMDAQVK